MIAKIFRRAKEGQTIFVEPGVYQVKRVDNVEDIFTMRTSVSFVGSCGILEG